MRENARCTPSPHLSGSEWRRFIFGLAGRVVGHQLKRMWGCWKCLVPAFADGRAEETAPNAMLPPSFPFGSNSQNESLRKRSGSNEKKDLSLTCWASPDTGFVKFGSLKERSVYYVPSSVRYPRSVVHRVIVTRCVESLFGI